MSRPADPVNIRSGVILPGDNPKKQPEAPVVRADDHVFTEFAGHIQALYARTDTLAQAIQALAEAILGAQEPEADQAPSDEPA